MNESTLKSLVMSAGLWTIISGAGIFRFTFGVARNIIKSFDFNSDISLILLFIISFFFILSAFLVLGGIGLMFIKEWSRRLTLVSLIVFVLIELLAICLSVYFSIKIYLDGLSGFDELGILALIVLSIILFFSMVVNFLVILLLRNKGVKEITG